MLNDRHTRSFVKSSGNSPQRQFCWTFFHGLTVVLALVKRTQNGQPYWGFVNTNGKEIVPCIYNGAQSFSEGLAAVNKGGKWGFVDSNGKEVIPCIYYSVEKFKNGKSLVNHNGKSFYINKNGNTVN